MSKFSVLTRGEEELNPPRRKGPIPELGTRTKFKGLEETLPQPVSDLTNEAATQPATDSRGGVTIPLIAATILIFLHLGRPFDQFLSGYRIPAVLCGMGIVVMFFTKWLSALRTRVGITLILFVMAMCCASVFSMWRGGSASYVQQYVQFNVVMFCLVATSADTLGKVRWILLAVVLSCAFDLSIGTAFDTEGRLFIQNSSLGNSGDVALLGGFIIPFVLFLASRLNRALAFVAGTVGVLACIAVVELSGTRSGLIGLATMTAVYFLRGSSARKIGLLAGLGVAVIGSILLLPKATLDRLSTITATVDMDEAAEKANNSSEAVGSLQDRRQLALDAIQAFYTHPILGVGPDAFPDWRFKTLGRRFMVSHNTYLQVAAESGLVGLVTYVAFLGAMFVTLLKCSKAAEGWSDGRPIAYAVEASLVYFSTVAFSLTCVAYTHQFVLAGLAVALDRIRQEQMTKKLAA